MATQRPAAEKLKILIVDDDETLRITLSAALEANNFTSHDRRGSE